MSNDEKRHALVGAEKTWNMKRDFQINFLNDHGMKCSDVFLDIGCGTLRGGIPIIEALDTNNYHGIEVRGNVLEEGKQELKEKNLENKNPTLVCFDDFSDLSFDTKFDILFAFSVLIHLNDTILAACFDFVGRYISDGGVFYANVNIGNRPEGEWQGFPVVYHSIEFYTGLAESNGLKLEVMGSLGELGHDSGSKTQGDQVMLEIRKV